MTEHKKISMSESGFSLSELLIGLFLASIISTILIQMYLTTKQHFSVLLDSLECNLDVRWVQDLLSDSIKRAGFTPCLNLDLIPLNHDAKIASINFRDNPHPELTVHRMSEQFGELIALVSDRQIIVSADAKVRAKHNILIADCSAGELHQISAAKKVRQGLLLTLNEPITTQYASPTYIGEWLEEHWFIKPNQEKNNALYYQQAHSEELTAAIRSFHVNKKKVKDKVMVEVEFTLTHKKSYHFNVLPRS